MKHLRNIIGRSLLTAVIATSGILLVCAGCANQGQATTQPQTSADVLAEFGNDYAAVIDALTLAHLSGAINDKQWAEVLKYEAVVDAVYAKAIAVNAAGGNVLSVHSILNEAAVAMAALKAQPK